MKVVFASGNAGKVREVGEMLAPFDWTVIPQTDLFDDEADETGLTFVENALLKARHACMRTGLPAIGDDSGLEVAALGGAPGIYSSRFAGPEATDSSNIDKLLAELADVPAGERQASFYCAMVFLRHAEDPTPVIALGRWNGEILEAPRGEGGFGYDPVFYVPAEGCSAAELPPERKHQLSHRAQALHSLVEQIRTLQQQGLLKV
ncbi:XTP/dITP diphosphohydrolase [Sulfurivirga caldicuralii]|uniref:dITP/XTP pyrophosphatase n=1 Tax=Sulfurivirga caldicuralii TaxID=364032 RepID=A0A1N6DGB0_9GAMM|nr:RdgB/HAM1 family non-canonical purine NTP pyrophosphatase [Sulfurivirga caldicuralii]SIN69832.1 XTP/dITP diphosphohydrolase [Sulfurivirga caldicuralii]